jgi:hypothetical protein
MDLPRELKDLPRDEDELLVLFFLGLVEVPMMFRELRALLVGAVLADHPNVDRRIASRDTSIVRSSKGNFFTPSAIPA